MTRPGDPATAQLTGVGDLLHAGTTDRGTGAGRHSQRKSVSAGREITGLKPLDARTGFAGAAVTDCSYTALTRRGPTDEVTVTSLSNHEPGTFL